MAKIITIILIFVLYTCQESPNSTIPPNLFDDINNYTVNLNSNSGSFKDVVTLTWNQYIENDFQDYRIDNVIIEESEEIETTLILAVNEFKNIDFNIVNIDADTIISKNIEIFTRPIIPIDDFQVVASSDEWISELKWEPSTEIEFDRYTIYRSSNHNEFFNDLDNCDCITIDSSILKNQNTTSFEDKNTDWGDTYYYNIVTFDVNQNYRTSIIKSNTTQNIGTSISIDTLLTTNMLNDKIILSWNYISHNPDIFYHTEIFRSDSYNGMESPELICTITDPSKNTFSDSYGIGSGISWFYQIKITDAFGNSYNSEISIGQSAP